MSELKLRPPKDKDLAGGRRYRKKKRNGSKDPPLQNDEEDGDVKLPL